MTLLRPLARLVLALLSATAMTTLAPSAAGPIPGGQTVERATTQIAPTKLTTAEKAMWQEYVALLDQAAPDASLESWARKHKARVVGRADVLMTKVIDGGPGGVLQQPDLDVVLEATNCKKHCPGDFQTDDKVTSTKGAWRIVNKCTLKSCKYNKTTKKWDCSYDCKATVTIG